MNKKVLILICILPIIYVILYWMNASYIEDYGLPIIHIDLNDVNLETIHKNGKDIKYYNNSIKIIDNHKLVLDSSIMIKGRGNQTWTLDKKPYQIVFDKETSILELPSSRKYVLLANANDPSLIKNDFSYRIAKKMSLNYSFTGQYADLYIDDHYLGNYYITPKIGINDATVAIKDDHAILVELDNTYYMFENEKEVFESDIFGDHIVLKDSNNKNTSLADFSFFQDKYHKMEYFIKEQDYESLKLIIDLESFAKYYIISEFSENSDAIHSSLFFYMDGYQDLIHVGPLWDCDITYGQRPEYSNYNQMSILNHEFPEGEGYSILFYQLLQMEEFRDLVKKVWKETGRSVYLNEINIMDDTISKIQKSAIKNNQYWKMVPYSSATSTVKLWIKNRFAFFDSYMGESL